MKQDWYFDRALQELYCLRTNGLCVCCLAKGKITPAECARIAPELYQQGWNPSSLRSYCTPCAEGEWSDAVVRARGENNG
jgi:hypothetical protein